MSCASLALLAFACAACGVQRPENPIGGEAAYAHVAKLVGFGPRPAGSQALARSRAYILRELEKAGLEPKTDSFEDKKNAKGIVFQNIECEIPGTRKVEEGAEGRMLVLGTHYDTKLCRGHEDPAHNFEFVGANDGGSGSGLLLELARHFKKQPLPVTLLLVWFDGEESIDWEWGEGKRALFGSRRCVKKLRARFPKTKPLPTYVPVMVLLDMCGTKDLQITRDTTSDSKLTALFDAAAKELGYGKKFFAKSKEVEDDHTPFQNYGIATLDLIDFGDEYTTPEWWHTKDDTLDIVSAESLGIVGHVVAVALPKVAAKFYE